MGREWFIIGGGGHWSGHRPRAWRPMGTGSFLVLTGSGTFVMRFLPFRGIGRAAWFPERCSPGTSLGGPGATWGRTDVKKVKFSDRSSVKHLAALESNAFSSMLPIVEALAVLVYEDGSPRAPGYLGLWSQGATWFARITDKDAGAQLTCEGRTIDEALGTLALLLTAEDAPWERQRAQKRK